MRTLTLYKDTLDLVINLYRYLPNFPKNVQYGQGEVAIGKALDAIDCIYTACTNKDRQKDSLDKYLMLIGGVKARVRVFGELHFLSVKQSTFLMRCIDKLETDAKDWISKI